MDWQEARRDYRKIPVPEELSDRLESVLSTGGQTGRSPAQPRPARRRRTWMFRIAGAAAAVLVLFVTGLNMDTAFAASVEDIPVLGQIARVFVFENYTQEDESRVLNVTLPELVNTGYDDLENRINAEIQLKMNGIIAKAEENARAYHEARLQTGSKDMEMPPMEISVDYEIKCSNEHYVSFILWKSESLASVYYEQYFYNIDLETGKELTLRDMLGPDYIRVASEAVKQQIEERIAANPKQLFFGYGADDTFAKSGFSEISPNQSFYINEEGRVVLVFEKYSIAPGSMGRPEFVVEP